MLAVDRCNQQPTTRQFWHPKTPKDNKRSSIVLSAFCRENSEWTTDSAQLRCAHLCKSRSSFARYTKGQYGRSQTARSDPNGLAPSQDEAQLGADCRDNS